VKLWGETEDRLESKHTYTGHTLGVVSVAVEATGTYAASSALDSFIRVWNLKDSTTKAIIETQPSETWQITFAPPGDQLQIAAAGAVHAPHHDDFVMQRCMS
jgi:WD repeat-containing protein 61